MNNEQMILQRLDHLEKEVSLLTDSARSLRELRDDLSPRVNEAVKIVIKELAEIEADCQLEDLLFLLKNLVRNVRNMNWSLDQLKNLVDLVGTVEPLLKSSVPEAIHYLDQLERKGVFQILSTSLGVVQKIAETYTPEDFEQIGDGLVRLVGVVKKLTSAPALDLLDRAAEIPARVDLSRARKVGPFGLVFALGNDEVKQGMGVLLEMTKGLSLLTNGGRGKPESIAAAQDKKEEQTAAEEEKSK